MSVVVAIAAGALVPVGTSAVAAQTSQAARGVVVVANGWSPPDVGAAAPLAGRLDAAVLYAPKDELGQPTIDALEELNPSRVLLMGGTAALTSAVESGVRSALPGVTVERFSGDDRIDTAARAALSEPAVPAGRPVVIANGWSPPDVGTAAPVAAQLGGSVLYADRGELGAPTAAALRRLVPSRVVIVGGLAAVSADIETEIASVVPGAVIERLSGTDRVDTAALSIDLAGVSLGGPVVLANGWSAPDVGIAAPLAGALGGSVLLTERSGLGERTAEALEDFSPSQIILIGGTEQFAEAVDADLERLHPGIPRVNIAGPDRITTAALAAVFGVQYSAEQQRFEEAVATITPGEADCDAAPRLDAAGIDVVDPPADINDPTAPLTVAEVVRIAGGCTLVDYVALNGRTVVEVRGLLADHPDVFAVSEPLRGFEPLHDTRSKAHHWFGPNSGVHEHHNDGAGEQWHLPEDYMRELWDGWDDANPVSVAVIDSGVDAMHPDLRGRVNIAGLSDCHVTDSWDTDPSLNNGKRLAPGGHGTHVAGIIAAGADNGGVAGVAPDATIIPVNIWPNWNWPGGLPPPGGFAEQGQGDRNCRHRTLRPGAPGVLEDGILEAVAHAINAGARVINMSFGRSFTAQPRDDACGGPDKGDRFRPEHVPIAQKAIERILGRTLDPTDCDALRLLLEVAEAKGVVNVAAAGNCGKDCDAYDPATGAGQRNFVNSFSLPAGYDDSVIAVAAVDVHGDRAGFSTARSYVDIAAPGVAILSSAPSAKPGTYDYLVLDGTSMAAPFISGVVAHMLNRHPDAQPWQVRRALADTARLPGWSASWLDPNRARKQLEYGHGIVQPREAILRLGELMDLNRAANQIDDIQVTGHACPIGDETPSCADPAPLSLQPKFAANTYPGRRKYTVEVPKNVDHVSVNIDYSSNGRPGGMLFNLADAAFQTAGHQVRFPRNRDTVLLRIWLPTWNGDPTRVPYELTLVRSESDEQPSLSTSRTTKSIAAGSQHTCAIRANGIVECWGSKLDGRTAPGAGFHGQSDPPSGQFIAIAAGGVHTCGIRTNGDVGCWGSNSHGQSDPPPGQFIAIAAGGVHTCGIRTNGDVGCWGSNSHGQSDPPPGQFIAIAAGQIGLDGYSCGIRADSSVQCWGPDGRRGTYYTPPWQLAAIGAGYFGSYGIGLDGIVHFWKSYPFGGTLPSLGQFTAIAVGHSHWCGIRLDRSIYCRGSNSRGQSDPPPGQFRTNVSG